MLPALDQALCDQTVNKSNRSCMGEAYARGQHAYGQTWLVRQQCQRRGGGA